jgi:hypothetical protein
LSKFPRRLFALDQNFPKPIAQAFEKFLTFVELVPVRDIDVAMSDLEDWDLLTSLHRHDRSWDGLITSDDSMLSDARTLAVLRDTHLTLVVTDGHGHNHIRASGLVLFHLEHVCASTTPSRAQIWHLRASQKPAETPDVYLQKIAAQKKKTVAELLADVAAERTDEATATASAPAKDPPDSE